MNLTDAESTLDSLMASYPRHGLNAKGVEAWIEAVRDTEADPTKTLEIARRWARAHEWFPSLAEFLTAITPRRPVGMVDDPDEWRVSPVVARELASVWRQALADVDKRIAQNGVTRGVAGHWHGGDTPCPLCGGRRPIR